MLERETKGSEIHTRVKSIDLTRGLTGIEEIEPFTNRASGSGDLAFQARLSPNWPSKLRWYSGEHDTESV